MYALLPYEVTGLQVRLPETARPGETCEVRVRVEVSEGTPGDHVLRLEVRDPAYDWMLAQNDHPEWGARPLRRIIRRYLREPLADYLLAAEPKPGARVVVNAGDEGLRFQTT